MFTSTVHDSIVGIAAKKREAWKNPKPIATFVQNKSRQTIHSNAAFNRINRDDATFKMVIKAHRLNMTTTKGQTCDY